MTDIYLSNDQEIFQEKAPEWILGRVSVVLDVRLDVAGAGRGWSNQDTTDDL